MSEKELPLGWAWVRLSDVLSEPLINGRSVRTLDGGFPVLRLTSIKDGSIDLSQSKEGAWSEEDARPFLVAEGDYLLSRGSGSRKLVGRGGLVGEVSHSVSFPDTMVRVRVDTEVMAPKYLRHLWGSPLIRRQVESQARTTAGIYKVNQKILESISFPLPPLAEQGRIVEALEECLSRQDAAVRSVLRASKRTDLLRSSLTDMTLGYAPEAGTETASLLDPVGSEDGVLPVLPPDWSWCRLGDLAEVVGGVTKDQKKQSDPVFPEVPYLRVANVQRGRLDLAKVSRIRVSAKRAEQLKLIPGDVLLNEGGDRNKLGRGWVWGGQVAGAIHQNHVFRARIRNSRLHPKLLSWHANRSGAWFELNGKQSVNLASISLSRIKCFPVPVPPREAQERILERIEGQLSLLEKAEVLATQVLSMEAALRRAILNRAFTGTLVPQDPTDEPASTLLTRIRAERAAQPKAKRTRRAATAQPKAKKTPATAPSKPAPSPTAAPAHAVQQEFDL
ncbi:restriction endonuclease subunit S [Streptomyces anulatus]|uniref:restriction endonuclease subunit S n=1 Tax=Streptomyces anulatus TaxID=1892 RepID=UPI003640B46B